MIRLSAFLKSVTNIKLFRMFLFCHQVKPKSYCVFNLSTFGRPTEFMLENRNWKRRKTCICRGLHWGGLAPILPTTALRKLQSPLLWWKVVSMLNKHTVAVYGFLVWQHLALMCDPATGTLKAIRARKLGLQNAVFWRLNDRNIALGTVGRGDPF